METNHRTLVVVESPTKAKTLNKFLPKNYKIMASMGHIIDLPKSRLAVDVEKDFHPDYITVRGRAKILNQIKREASKAEEVLLASDPDREGEAISYHLKNVLQPFNKNVKRIEFHEITEEAIRNAVAEPRIINMNLFYAQQARRILDRLVGYNISPILWKKVKKGLSAGRVQSVTLRMLCEREVEIENFVSEEYWTIEVDLHKGNKKVRAALFGFNEKKIEIQNKEQADSIISVLSQGIYQVNDLRIQDKQRKAPPPYTTSKLQQDAATRLGYVSSKTMMIAQQLYEGIDLGIAGSVGLITYMRTDSVRVSESAINKVRDFILKQYGAGYLPSQPNFFSSKKNAQDAHEAIRPTDPFRTPASIKDKLTRDQFRLYELIWQKFVASQLNPELYEQVTLSIKNGSYLFRASGKKVKFKGFTVVMDEIIASSEGKEKKEKLFLIPTFSIGEELNAEQTYVEQHFTSPPPRYNDASIVKKLEESGIGRPSTYAPTISTLMKRYYVSRASRQLIPTQLGRLVNDMLVGHFERILEPGFTASMESKLDQIEDGSENWVTMLHDFYNPFILTVEHAIKNIEEVKSILDEPTDFFCEVCGRPMVKKLGKFGYFLACTGFPECRNAKPVPLGPCPMPGCEGHVIKKSTKRGRPFFGCSKYPSCHFSSWHVPVPEQTCTACGAILFENNRKRKNEENHLQCLNLECERFVPEQDSSKQK